MDASGLNSELRLRIIQAIALADQMESHVVAAILSDALVRCGGDDPDDA